MNTRKYIAAVSFIFLISTAVLLLPTIYTSRDLIKSAPPPSYHIADTHNRIEDQNGGFCGAYAAAYVMRYFGEEVSGDALADDLNQTFGFTSPHAVAGLLKDHGYDAKAYHGDLDTMKTRLSQGTPVIVYLRIPHDTHYAVVTGYDENTVYLADSLPENANAQEATYNRTVGIEEFEALWKAGVLLDNNIYIAVNQKR